MHICRLVAALILVAVIGSAPSAQDNSNDQQTFHPKDPGHLEMFLESVKGLAVATNTSQQAYDNTGENTVLAEVWSDQRRFPHGTVRWWLDQSPYTNDKRIRPSRVFQTGRDIGQDDHDRPGYIPDGCNGRPCVRGGLIGADQGKGTTGNRAISNCSLKVVISVSKARLDSFFSRVPFSRRMMPPSWGSITDPFSFRTSQRIVWNGRISESGFLCRTTAH